MSKATEKIVAVVIGGRHDGMTVTIDADAAAIAIPMRSMYLDKHGRPTFDHYVYHAKRENGKHVTNDKGQFVYQ